MAGAAQLSSLIHSVPCSQRAAAKERARSISEKMGRPLHSRHQPLSQVWCSWHSAASSHQRGASRHVHHAGMRRQVPSPPVLLQHMRGHTCSRPSPARLLWGATPSQPQTFYCQRLMQWADQLASSRGQLAMEGFKQAAEAVFCHNGCSPPPAAFNSFNDALRHWRHVQHAASS